MFWQKNHAESRHKSTQYWRRCGKGGIGEKTQHLQPHYPTPPDQHNELNANRTILPLKNRKHSLGRLTRIEPSQYLLYPTNEREREREKSKRNAQIYSLVRNHSTGFVRLWEFTQPASFACWISLTSVSMTDWSRYLCWFCTQLLV